MIPTLIQARPHRHCTGVHFMFQVEITPHFVRIPRHSTPGSPSHLAWHLALPRWVLNGLGDGSRIWDKREFGL